MHDFSLFSNYRTLKIRLWLYHGNSTWEECGYGIHILSTANDIFYHNDFMDNDYQISPFTAAEMAGYLDDGSEGNFWSDYNGTGADGDSIGDTPYTIGLVTDRYQLMAPFDIDSVTVELPKWANHLILQPDEATPEDAGNEPPASTSEQFLTVPVIAASAASLVVVGAALTVYFKKRKR